MLFWTKTESTASPITVIFKFKDDKNDNIVYYGKTRMVFQCVQIKWFYDT